MRDRLLVRRLAAAAVGVLLLGATACTGDDAEADPPRAAQTSTDAEPDAPATTSTEPTVDVPVEPELPADAYEPTAENAVRFVEFYWEVVDYATVSGDVALLHELARDGCGACRGGEAAIEANVAAGAAVTADGQYRVSGGSAQELQSTSEFLVAFAVTGPTLSITDGSGTQVIEPAEANGQFLVQWSDEAWVMTAGTLTQ